MKLRAPAVPLIAVDPYFSLWSMTDKLNSDVTRHWTGSPNTATGIAVIDSKPYSFMGSNVDNNECKDMTQVSLDINAFSTIYTFAAAGVELVVTFTTPLLMDDLYLLSRPCSYIHVAAKSTDGKKHDVKIKFGFSDEFCINRKKELETESFDVDLGSDYKAIRMGSKDQPMLTRAGDDLRIEWGYFYVATKSNNSSVTTMNRESGLFIYADLDLNTESNTEGLVVLAYDDIDSLVYFGDNIKAYWKSNGDTIEDVILKAFTEYDSLMNRCNEFVAKLDADAIRLGGEKYAEILALAYRQAISGHKLVLDTEGQLLFVSKENFSNGCAATVDVSYPSTPLFLLFNPELVKGMMRPVFKYANTPVWPFDFAPHDVGTYPLLNGQVYSGGTDPSHQMPIEECGNMLVMAASVSVATDDASFAKENLDLLKLWADYLVENGVDPENQLCTDDFSGHLAHNVNLSAKAIMGVCSYGIIRKMLGDEQDSQKYFNTAKEMAEHWLKNAANGDGTFRLAFDKPDTYSLKYNVVWDLLFNTGLFPKEAVKSEFDSYVNKRLNKYGVPLDNREPHTKSDWLVWAATLSDNKEDFVKIIDSLWLAYHETRSRVPMTDWYDTIDARQRGFQARTVQGGLFITLLRDSEKCKFVK